MAASKNFATLCLLMVLAASLCMTTVHAQRRVIGLCAGFKRGPCNGVINCFVADPVCGANGVTYTCGCPEAACARVPVVKRGPC